LPKLLKRLLLTILLALPVAACGPMYDTTYKYVPPGDRQGRSCVRDCQSDKQECDFRVERVTRQCEREDEDRAEHAFRQYKRERAEAKLPLKKTVRDFMRHNCSSRASNKEERCDANFNMCFESCGGDVIEERECVAFCD
jgi:hypothetical protein